MLRQISAIADRLRHSAFAIPTAVVMALLMVGVNEIAYRGAQTRLERLAEIAGSRLLLSQTLRRMNEAESGNRGYMLTGGREYLQPYLDARSDVLANLQLLRKAYGSFGDADALTRLTRLDDMSNARLAEMEEVLLMIDRGKGEAALDVV
ncbi:MAG: CHASE3 domain-containing protein, partial [Aquabacterium sp.]